MKIDNAFIESFLRQCDIHRTIKSIDAIRSRWIDHVNYCWDNGMFAGVMASRLMGKTGFNVAMLLQLAHNNMGNPKNITVLYPSDTSAHIYRDLIKRSGADVIGNLVVRGENSQISHMGDPIKCNLELCSVYNDPRPGTRIDYLLMDDVFQNFKKDMKRGYIDMWMERVVPGGRVFSIGSPSLFNDNISMLLDMKGFSFLNCYFNDELDMVFELSKNPNYKEFPPSKVVLSEDEKKWIRHISDDIGKDNFKRCYQMELPRES
jgi:hypothetical protein